MPFQPKFTHEDLTEAMRLYSEFKNGHLVAEIMGWGRTTIYKHLALSIRNTPRWSDDEMQILVDGYLEKIPTKDIAFSIKRSPRAVRVRMCRYRQQIKKDPKKRRALRAITFALRAIKRADIFRELEA